MDAAERDTVELGGSSVKETDSGFGIAIVYLWDRDGR
jgi:hypothetical protein